MAFRAAGYDWRLFCGEGVIEANLHAAVRRAGAGRAFVICSPSINRRTNTVARIAAALGDSYAGVFDGIENDSTYASTKAAAEAAREAGADLLIAAGGGSVLVAVRCVAVFLGESGDPFALMTQYPADGRPFSPRLEAPKLPIINIPTTPTSAMNRAGSGLKNPDLDHRMEYFDPKTRPAAIFLDDEALLAAPLSVLRSTATTVYAGLVGSVGDDPGNPLVAGDLAQAFRLAADAYASLMAEPDSAEVRRNLSLAAFLQNRAEDDGRAMRSRGSFSANYAVATALHLAFPAIGQGESTCVLHASTIRLAEAPPLAVGQKTAEALDLSHEGLDARQVADAIADRLEATYQAMEMPVRLSELDVPRDALPAIAAETVKNFNASASLASAEDRIADSRRVLEAAY